MSCGLSLASSPFAPGAPLGQSNSVLGSAAVTAAPSVHTISVSSKRFVVIVVEPCRFVTASSGSSRHYANQSLPTAQLKASSGEPRSRDPRPRPSATWPLPLQLREFVMQIRRLTLNDAAVYRDLRLEAL